MIGYLRGKVLKIGEAKLIIDCNGVGYSVAVKEMVHSLHDEVSLWIHTYVKEDVLALYGFAEEEELYLFEKLLGISGVGPKVALQVLKAGTPRAIEAAIREADVDFFTAVPGIGKKGAQRIIVELKGKIGKDLNLVDSPTREDALKGLINLGYLKTEAMEALKKVDRNLPAEEQIKLALKNG